MRCTSPIEIQGIPLTIVDTAGLRPTDDPIETLGIERTWAAVARGRSRARAGRCRLRRHTSPRPMRRSSRNCRPRCRGSWCTTRSISRGFPATRGFPRGRRRAQRRTDAASRLPVGQDGRGRRSPETRDPGARRRARRHGGHVSRAANAISMRCAPPRRISLRRWRISPRPRPPPELVAEDLRAAHTALSAITGEFTSDDLLGVIFSRFCIGK